MTLTYDQRVELAKSKILPILAEYKLDIGAEHFLTTKVNPTKLIDFVDSRVKWIDLEAPKEMVEPLPEQTKE